MGSSGVTISMDTSEVVNGTLKMRGDRILVKPLEWNEHGDVSRIIAVERRGNCLRGSVVAVGPGVFPVSKRITSHDGKSRRIEFSKRFRPTEVRVGDVVELGGLNAFDGRGYSFPSIIFNGEKHLIVTERDVALVRDDLKETA